MDIRELIESTLDRLAIEREQERVKRAAPMYNVYCWYCGNIFVAPHGGPLEERCIEHERTGYIDAFIVLRCLACVDDYKY